MHKWAEKPVICRVITPLKRVIIPGLFFQTIPFSGAMLVSGRVTRLITGFLCPLYRWFGGSVIFAQVKFLWSSEEISNRAEEYWGQVGWICGSAFLNKALLGDDDA